jgi:hypothetical protein
MINENIVKEIICEMKNQFKNNEEYFAKTRDVFTAIMQSFVLETKKYLEAAIIGELGNNTFDHNFIFQNNYPIGVYCNITYKSEYTVVADFGKGIRQSLTPVVPSIGSDLEAVETAFTKKISGRFPEQRGNGLKFVSETIQQNNWHLYFQSGIGCCSIDKNGMNFFQRDTSLIGCLAIVKF